jgi:hypothetical protein
MFALRFICLAFLVAYSWNMGQIPPDGLNAFGKLVAFSFFLAVPGLYFLPTFEAWKKGHSNLIAIALVNAFLGWSLIGWVAALVWAFKRRNHQFPALRILHRFRDQHQRPSYVRSVQRNLRFRL